MKIIKEIIILAIPIIITGIILSIVGLIVTYSLHIFASPIAAFTYVIIINIESTLFTPIQGILKGLCIVTGHLSGSKRFLSLKKTIIKIFSLSIIIAGAIVLSIAIFHDPIISIFTTEYVVVNEVRNMLIFLALYMITFPIIMGCSYVFFGLEKSNYTLIFIIFNLITLTAFICLFNIILNFSSFGIYLAIFLSNTLEAGLMILVLKKILDDKINTYNFENEPEPV